MRSVLFALLSLAACATNSPDESGQDRPGGGKGDDPTEESACPVDASDGDAILAAIEGGGSCYVAAGIAESCAWGSGIDTGFVAAASEVCEAGFDAMTAAQAATYKALLARCDAKYAEQEGSLYRSAAAYCCLEVTKLENQLFPGPEAEEPTVAWSQSCPVDSGDPDAIEAAIRGAGYCGAAANIAEGCAWGSGVDGAFVSAATDACLTADLTSADQVIYDRLRDACETVSGEEGGSLGRSIRGYCMLQVEVVFDNLYTTAEE